MNELKNFRIVSRCLLGLLYTLGLTLVIARIWETFDFGGRDKFNAMEVFEIFPSEISFLLLSLVGSLPGLNFTVTKFTDIEILNKVKPIIDLILYIGIWFVFDNVITKVKGRNVPWFILYFVIFMIINSGVSLILGLVWIAVSTGKPVPPNTPIETSPIIFSLSYAIYILTFGFVFFLYWRAKIDARQTPQNP